MVSPHGSICLRIVRPGLQHGLQLIQRVVGGTRHHVLNLLLHRKDGLDVRIDPQDQPTGHFYSDDCTYIRMPGATGGPLDLRHLRDSPQTLKALQHADHKARCQDHTVQRRLELERIYGYPSLEKFLEL